jgi:hypothetical protein
MANKQKSQEDQELNNGVIETPEAEKPTKKVSKPASTFTVYEKWQLKNDKGELKRIGKLKDCKMLPEQASILNSQRHNSLIEYIQKEA